MSGGWGLVCSAYLRVLVRRPQQRDVQLQFAPPTMGEMSVGSVQTTASVSRLRYSNDSNYMYGSPTGSQLQFSLLSGGEHTDGPTDTNEAGVWQWMFSCI